MGTGEKETYWQWNPAFIVESADSESMVLRNDITGALVALSRGEYDLLQAYVVDNRFSSVSEAMTDYDVDDGVFQSVTGKAMQMDIVIPSAIAEIRQEKKQRQSVLKMKFIYIANLFVSLLQHLTRRPLRAECGGNLRFFKLCSIDLEGGWIYSLAKNKAFQKWLPIGYSLLTMGLLVLTTCNIRHFQFAGFGMTHVSVWWLFAAMVVSIFFCLLWHECGHYLIYKRFGGTGNRIGMGTIFGFFPVLYTQIDQIHLWKVRHQRILLTAAGVMADFVAMLAICTILSTWHQPVFLNLLLDCLFFYYAVQIITNLNIFMPGTDGYYLFEEVLGKERLYGNAFETARRFWKGVIHGTWGRFTFRQWLQVAYFLLCCVCITVYWAFAVMWFTFPLWGDGLF